MRKYLLFLSLYILTVFHSFGQDANFSLYYMSPLLLNPALTSGDPNTYVGVNHKSQILDGDHSYHFTVASVLHPLYFKIGNYMQHKGGIGLALYNETTGSTMQYSRKGALLSGGYNILLGSNGTQMISFGLQGGVFQQKVNFADFTWGSQYDPYTGFDPNRASSVQTSDNSVVYPQFNAGIMWYRNSKKRNFRKKINYYAGLAVSSLNRPNESVFEGQKARRPVFYKLHGGAEIIPRHNTMSVSPNFIITYQNQVAQVNVGTNINFNLTDNGHRSSMNYHLILGSWYRFGDSFIFNVGVTNDKFTAAFSYDANVSNLRYNTPGSGGYEIAVNYNLEKKRKVRNFSTPLM